MNRRADLIIIGGGVIGCSIAERTRHDLEHIIVIDAAPELGIEASAAAIGGITPQSGDFCLGPLGAVAQRSRELYPAWLSKISNEAQLEIPVLDTGQLQIAIDATELERFEEEVAPALRSQGAPVESLSKRQLLAEEPLLSTSVLGGLLLPAELAIEPELLMKALRAILLKDDRVHVMPSTTVMGLSTAGEVTLVDGTALSADRVVVAAGHLSDKLLHASGNELYPVKGQALEFAAEPVGLRPRRQCYARVACLDGHQTPYVVPRSDGRIMAGVTFEPGVRDIKPTAGGRRAIIEGIATLFPAVARWRVSRHWAGIRPATKDGAPVIGWLQQDKRIIAATGHYGLGITLAPVTADYVTRLLVGEAIDESRAIEMKVCDPGRFELFAGLAPGLTQGTGRQGSRVR
jgi:glycine oxidase